MKKFIKAISYWWSWHWFEVIMAAFILAAVGSAIYYLNYRAEIKEDCFKTPECEIVKVGNEYFYTKYGVILLKERVE